MSDVQSDARLLSDDNLRVSKLVFYAQSTGAVISGRDNLRELF